MRSMTKGQNSEKEKKQGKWGELDIVVVVETDVVVDADEDEGDIGERVVVVDAADVDVDVDDAEIVGMVVVAVEEAELMMAGKGWRAEEEELKVSATTKRMKCQQKSKKQEEEERQPAVAVVDGRTDNEDDERDEAHGPEVLYDEGWEKGSSQSRQAKGHRQRERTKEHTGQILRFGKCDLSRQSIHWPTMQFEQNWNWWDINLQHSSGRQSEWWMVNGEWWMVNGEWWMVNGEWWMVNGEWWMGNGNEAAFSFTPFIQSAIHPCSAANHNQPNKPGEDVKVQVDDVEDE